MIDVLAFLRRELGEEGIPAVLEAAGEGRSLEALWDPSTESMHGFGSPAALLADVPAIGSQISPTSSTGRPLLLAVGLAKYEATASRARDQAAGPGY